MGTSGCAVRLRNVRGRARAFWEGSVPSSFGPVGASACGPCPAGFGPPVASGGSGTVSLVRMLGLLAVGSPSHRVTGSRNHSWLTCIPWEAEHRETTDQFVEPEVLCPGSWTQWPVSGPCLPSGAASRGWLAPPSPHPVQGSRRCWGWGLCLTPVLPASVPRPIAESWGLCPGLELGRSQGLGIPLLGAAEGPACHHPGKPQAPALPVTVPTAPQPLPLSTDLSPVDWRRQPGPRLLAAEPVTGAEGLPGIVSRWRGRVLLATASCLPRASPWRARALTGTG